MLSVVPATGGALGEVLARCRRSLGLAEGDAGGVGDRFAGGCARPRSGSSSVLDEAGAVGRAADFGRLFFSPGETSS